MQISNDELYGWLKTEDDDSRNSRVKRLKYLVQEFGEIGYISFYGGIISYHAFEELRLSFLNGQFIGCVLLSQIVAEHILAGLFEMQNQTDLKNAGFLKLLDEAFCQKIISQEEFDAFDSIRKTRNPYVHKKEVSHKNGIVSRMIDEKKTVESLFEENACTAIKSVFRLLNRYPFSFPVV